MKVQNKYIGCNFFNGTRFGGIISSYGNSFTNEEVLFDTDNVIKTLQASLKGRCYTWET